MRHSARWMTLWDDRILEVLAADGPVPVGDLDERDSFRVSKSTISRRCRKLSERGLVEAIGNGVYRATAEGESYLTGAYDVAEGEYLDSGVTEG